ncbi:MAG TPA: Uma2 family endonuclease [Nocardioidaceae bacterium]|nr:Uma2 family endonuclease [Nocardioidaceae bacterium]
METVTTLPRSGPLVLPRGRALIRDDLKALPDDGHRYELIDGTLIVSPAPRPRHQTVVLEFAVVLRDSCPDHMRVFVAPLDVALASDTLLQPDVLVSRRTDVTDDNLPVAPLLAVEVLSPSTRRIDLTVKRSRYEEAGCASYWVVDPDEPSIIAWELHDGVYVEVAHVTGEERFTTEHPYPITFSPSDLLD